MRVSKVLGIKVRELFEIYMLRFHNFVTLNLPCNTLHKFYGPLRTVEWFYWSSVGVIECHAKTANEHDERVNECHFNKIMNIFALLTSKLVLMIIFLK